MKEIYRCVGVEQTEALARNVARNLPKHCFLALYGGLGMGKTAFVRGLASVLTPDCRVTSPTYTLVNCYTSSSYRINHFDLYRIQDEDSLESIGFFDTVEEGITVCEWCENVPYALPERYLKVEFSRLGENEREITLTLIGAERYADLRT